MKDVEACGNDEVEGVDRSGGADGWVADCGWSVGDGIWGK